VSAKQASCQGGGDRGSVGKKSNAGAARAERDRLRTAILDEAAVVCSTLSFAGAGVFSRLTRKCVRAY
jgi:hypothetical protein